MFYRSKFTYAPMLYRLCLSFRGYNTKEAVKMTPLLGSVNGYLCL